MDRNAVTFNTGSDLYARARPRYPDEFYAWLVTQTGNHTRLWDCACGNGQVSRGMVPWFDEISATDISENQINNAFRHPKITYSLSPSECTFFADGSFDMICVGQAAHWFHLPEFFAEADRVLKPGGILAIFGYGFFRMEDETDGIIMENFLGLVDKYWSEGNRLFMNGFPGIEFPFREVEPPDFPMNQDWSLDELMAFLDTWSAVKRYNEEHRKNIVRDLRALLLPLWKENENRTVKMDMYNFVRKKVGE